MSDNRTTIDAARSESDRPKYQQIRDEIYQQIRSGRLGPGQLLPTEAKLVKSLGISRHTVRHALAELENDGIIHRVQGRGTFVTTEQQRQARQQLNVFALVAGQLQGGLVPALLHGFEQECAGCNHQTIVRNSGNDVGRQADLLMQMIDQAVGGVALVPTTRPDTPPHQIRLLQNSNIPVVLCHRAIEGVSAPSVVLGGREIGLKAGQALVEQGHRRIAFLFAHRYTLMEAYDEGLRSAFVHRGLNPAGIEQVEYSALFSAPSVEAEQAIHQRVEELLKRENRPTAIFCSNAADAEVVYLHANSMGFSIPRDLSLMHLGNVRRERGLEGRLSGVAVDENEIGATAARLLHEMRTGRRPLDSQEQIVAPVSLLAGETLGPATAT